MEVVLRVRALAANDQYKDTARVYWSQRNNVSNGSIARVMVNGRGPYFLAMRGTGDDKRDTIGLDHLNREDMGLTLDEEARFTFEHANPLQSVRWAMNSADPAGRIATWIALVSFAVGVLYPIVYDVLKWLLFKAIP